MGNEGNKWRPLKENWRRIPRMRLAFPTTKCTTVRITIGPFRLYYPLTLYYTVKNNLLKRENARQFYFKALHRQKWSMPQFWNAALCFLIRHLKIKMYLHSRGQIIENRSVEVFPVILRDCFLQRSYLRPGGITWFWFARRKSDVPVVELGSNTEEFTSRVRRYGSAGHTTFLRIAAGSLTGKCGFMRKPDLVASLKRSSIFVTLSWRT